MVICNWLFATLLLSWAIPGVTLNNTRPSLVSRRRIVPLGTREVKCGVRPLRKTATNSLEMYSRIVGGVNSRVGGQPWTVSLQLYNRHICGGSIVEKNVVVTAAHCVDPVSEEKVKNMMVVVGEYDQNVIDPQQQNIPVSHVKIHPKYQSDGSMSYDIALVYLYKRIVLGTRVQRVCLPQVGERIEPGTLCISSGWGRVNENGAPSNILQEVKLPILDDDTCSSVLDYMGLPTLHKSMLCAGFPDGGKDACQGDSGGPLVCKRRSGTWVLVGCSSWGVGCGRAWGKLRTNKDVMGSPAIYARVSALLDFLRHSTADSSCSPDPLVIVARSGIIKYPLDTTSNYSSNSLCRWTIISSEHKIIQVQFIKLDIEDHITCAHDSLTFTVKRKDFRKVCGSVLPSPLIIPSNKVAVTFLSDGTVNGGGFQFKFSTLSATSEKGSGCGSAALLKEEGKIFSLNYPGLYPSHTTCRWVIEAPEGNVIQLRFEVFAVEYQKECAYDRVAIFGDRDETQLIATLCGFSVTREIFSPRNIMVITFESDLENNYSGFMAKFNFLSPGKNKPPTSTGLSPVSDPEPKHVDSSVCGVAPLSPQWLLNRIIGGEESCPNCWPWQALLMFRQKFHCGGAILSPEWVLTAAHCLPSSDLSLYAIRAGIHDLHLEESSQQEKTIQSIAAHEMFDITTYDYDIALLRLDGQFTFNDVVRPVCLPQMDDPLEPSSLCAVTGWGKTQEVGKTSSRLQQLQVPILNNEICNSSYHPGLISERMFCAGFLSTGGKDACQGDSGGPLVCPSANKSYVLYGIVSWGVGCARVKKPGVYTRVRSFLSWIQNTQQGINKALHDKDSPIQKLMTIRKDGSSPAECPDGLHVGNSVGSIASPGYPYGYAGGLHCSWVVSSSSSSSVIKIVVEHQSIEESVNCVAESLSIYQEANNGSQLLGKTCGFLSAPITYECLGPTIRVVFNSISGGMHSRRGFVLQYRIYGGQVFAAREFPEEMSGMRAAAQERCHDRIETSDNGVISSPGYPKEYFNDLRCEWRIIAPLGSVIRLDIDYLNTEEDDTGCQDSLLVYEGASASNLLLGTFCGNESHHNLKSRSPEMTLVFMTNSRVAMKGFSLRYAFWKLQPDSMKRGDNQSVVGCPIMGLLTAGSADLKSPVYPSIYLNGLDCWWIVHSASGNRLELLIMDLALEDSPNCTWDFLKVYDGASNETRLLVTLCGNKSNRVFYSSRNFLTLHFHTDESVGSRGFHVHYSEITTSSTVTFRSVATSKEYDAQWDGDGETGRPGKMLEVSVFLRPFLEEFGSVAGCIIILKVPVSIGGDMQHCWVFSSNDNCGNTHVDPMPRGKSAMMAEVVTDDRGTPRLVGGHAAAFKSWPWIVNLQDKYGKTFCGAAIIHEKWILTAAHCGFIVGSDRVFVGMTDLSLRDRTEAMVRKSYVHDLYDQYFLPPDYDICLLELKTSLVLGDSVGVICLPQESDVFAHDGCLTAGWGSTKGRSLQYSKILQQAKIPLVSTESCKNYWGTDITESNLCAGAAGATSCLGDSGGPLICNIKNQYKLVGIVSWGSDTCDPHAPAVYTSVSKYRHWIQQHTGF